MDWALVEMTKIMLEDRITIEWAFLRIRRVLTTLDSALVHLYPDVNYIRLMEDYFDAAEKRSLVKAARELPARTVKGVRDLFELQEKGNEYLFLQRAIIRRQAQVFEGTTSKFAYLFQIVFGQLASIELAAGIVFLIAFLHQHHNGLVQPWMGAQIARLVAIFPQLDYPVWVIIMLVDVYLCVTAYRLKAKFAERENRGTDRSSSL
jgi:predicted unusual protein kinase regulating ubiquinone biosynthesis (AarF/ABC1/UbiB family)